MQQDGANTEGIIFDAMRAYKPHRLTLEQRFWAKVNKDGPVPVHRPGLGQCWIWKRPHQSGYGYIGVTRGKTTQAHKVGYELQVGPIPSGLWVLHYCDNKACVRGSHLYTGNHIANMRDVRERGNMRAVPNSDVASVRARIKQGETQQSIADELGVSRWTISHVVRGDAHYASI